MKPGHVLGVGAVLGSLAVGAAALAPPAYGQPGRDFRQGPDATILQAPGSQIGVRVRDLEGAEVKQNSGVVIERVRPGGPAEQAGLKDADIVTKFDGENVRSARQFTRLVRETPPGRTVSATVVRDGRSMELSITPVTGDGLEAFGIWRDVEPRLRDRLGDLTDRIPFDFDFPDVPFAGSRARLGVVVQDLTPQLKDYFGAKEGVLVSSVSDNSPASRAGLKAGDIIRSIDADGVRSRSDLTRLLREARDDAEVTIGIVRDKKESSLKAKLEPPRARRTLRPARTTRSI